MATQAVPDTHEEPFQHCVDGSSRVRVKVTEDTVAGDVAESVPHMAFVAELLPSNPLQALFHALALGPYVVPLVGDVTAMVGAAGVLVSEKFTEGFVPPVAVADTLYVPGVALAVNADEVACPLAAVVLTHE